MENLIDAAKKVLTIEALSIQELKDRINEDFIKAVEIIHNSKGRVVVTGIGKSGLVGRKISATLASTGTPSFFMHPAEASHGDLGMVTEDDVVIAISNSGETEEVLRLIPYLKYFNVKIIALTGNPQSTLAKQADVVLDVSVKEEACPFGFIPTASTTVTMAMGDAIAVALIMRNGFKKDDFAVFHPGGSLGRRMLTKVKDLMHTGEELPVAYSDTLMLDAILEISSKRLGVVVIVDENKRILGIITDGDIRRGVQRWGKELFELKASQIMTKNPKTINEEELAAVALSTMQKYSITSLVVPASDGTLKGLIHIHDILKKGIF
ncbi:MAG: KpsF/GutQ family sugar-phosphate isomerase [Thermodesulfovibrio sp.]|jgi:arabinose-5-phosphate isomerase|uniref:KpsF/GutQ family sugar-phosphate isomerase n=1 Tax=unclassified Thermodesulfovibrio TaxID=2645936 RepID=UPI00083B6B57|nr:MULTISPECIES: KpsF/GutQ family sugar-phosphate isomerase [unclassified Thermodesulfovibrio]MDI1471066.1 KpsF/GutQ family sugar-phosphate isomerase [Thermodesulfovibrio sp. 1176]MDI6713916.1 KpsF/GutQ family sugar-phosphate isomerase [Thermodesulfovibrio sp.]ODA43693.1 Arabinose 5-phosphate isomerase [Thermodesulfovibrio sp. N1]